MFFKDEPNRYLNSLLEGKRVVIVGPAHYLTGQSRGHLIDEYDVVIRPNQFYVPTNLYQDYGSRTDIMFHNCGTPWMPGLQEQVAANPKELMALKMVVCPIIKADHSETDFMSWPDDYSSACAYNFRSINTTIPFYWIGVRNYREVYKQINREPYTGVMTICTVLHYPIEELYVTGFDFYTNKKVYHDGFLSSFEKQCEVENFGGSHGPDGSYFQLKFLKSIYDKTDIFSVDPKLQKLFLTV
jgi:hypothetical protein